MKTEMPWKEKDRYVEYHDGKKQFKVLFIMYADFENILKPMEKNSKGRVNKHVFSEFCMYTKFAYASVLDSLKAYRRKDCVEQFVEHIEAEVKFLYTMYPQHSMIPLTKVLKKEYEEASTCHICMKPFYDPEKNWKVHDHCHYTGLYRGAAHNNCNLKYKILKHISIVFYNLSCYDAHLFIRQLGEKFQAEDIGEIAENKEKCISFNVKIPVQLEVDGKPVTKNIELQFINSYRLMASSLDSLARNLTDEECKNMQWFYQEEDVFELMQRKGVYTYKYMDKWERFKKTRLPPNLAFHSNFYMTDISDKDYEYAQQVRNTMTVRGYEKTLGSYHNFYLKTDELLLADIFDIFPQYVSLEPAPAVNGVRIFTSWLFHLHV